MYERSYGDKYEQGYQSASQIAKKIRADIKAAIADGSLPGTPKNYTVRSRSYAGGQAIDVRAVNLPGLWQVCEGFKPGSKKPFDEGDGWTATACGDVWCKAGGEHRDLPGATEHLVLTVAGAELSATLKGIHGAYNHDGSEVQIDYFDRKYWGLAEIERPSLAEFLDAEPVTVTDCAPEPPAALPADVVDLDAYRESKGGSGE